MGDGWIRDIEITTLIAVSSVLIVLPLQLLLCFKAQKLFIRLLPSIVLTATTVLLFILMRSVRDWSAIIFVIAFVFSGTLLVFSGIAWGAWAIVKLIKRKQYS